MSRKKCYHCNKNFSSFIVEDLRMKKDDVTSNWQSFCIACYYRYGYYKNDDYKFIAYRSREKR